MAATNQAELEKPPVVARTLIVAAVVILSAAQIFPLLWLFDFSFMPSSAFFGSALLKWPSPPKWQNYIDAFTHGKVVPFFLNSTLVTFTTIAITVLCSVFMAYTFSRMIWKWKTVVLAAVLIGLIIPVQTTLLANFSIFQKVGLLDTYWALILPGIAFNIPISTFIMTGFLASLPRDLEEVAVIDGLNIFQLVLRIVLPLCAPAIATISVMVFLSSWSDYINPLTFISSDSLKTLPFSIIQFQGQYSSNYGAQYAVLSLICIPTILVYIFFSEQINRGIMSGAVKG